MKRLLFLLVLLQFGLGFSWAARVEFKVTGVQSGDQTVVSIGSDAYLATKTVTTDGSYAFEDVPSGKMFLKIEASGYNLPQALTVIVNGDGSVTPEVPQTLAITKMSDDPNTWIHSWQEDGSLSGYTTTAYINKRPEVEFLGKKIVPADVPSVAMLYSDYHIILSDEDQKWTQEYAYRLYETLKTIPYYIGMGYSKFILTESKIDDDIKIETSGNDRIVTIGEDAFYYANPFLVNLDGVRGRFFSKRLHHALVNYATNFGEAEGQVNRILHQRFGCTMSVPDYKELTDGITDEDETHFQKFFPSERVSIINMLEELPEGFHKTQHLNYLVRRINGMKHPLYPGAAAVSWCVDNGYIEFMEDAFGGNNQDFETLRLILHEKTHFLWAFTFSDEIKNDWIKVGGWYQDPNAGGWATTKDVEFVTQYAHGHNPDEDMAESVAYYIKDPDKLRSRALEKYEFIRDRIMSGTRYISKIPDHLTFEVLNLNPDYDYPGKIKRLNVKVEGAPEEDKKVSVEIELNHMDGFDDGASYATARLLSPTAVNEKGETISSFVDLWMVPYDGTQHKLHGEITISKYSKSGYWMVSDISVSDAQQNERFAGRNDVVWNMYVNNPLEDFEKPTYESGSIKYEVKDAEKDGHKIKNLIVTFKCDDNIGIKTVYVGFNVLNQTKYTMPAWGTWDKNTKTARVEIPITEFYPSGDYFVESIDLTDGANLSRKWVFCGGEHDEPIVSVHIDTANPDSEAPTIDLNRISVYAEPTHPEAPDGETKVTISYYARDDKSGYDLGSYILLDPQGIRHDGTHYIPGYYKLFFNGDPTVWQKYTINCVLPQGSAPGIWGLASMGLRDKAMNERTYNFVETLIFEPDDNIDDYILLSDIKDNELTLKMAKTESNGHSYGYRIINEDTGEEISGEMNQQTTSKARAKRASDSSVMEADFSAVIDLSKLSDGNCIAIVQVKDADDKPVAVRNSRFVKGNATNIDNIADGKYDKLSPIYDLQGRKVDTPVKGVYIQNGRKFVVK